MKLNEQQVKDLLAALAASGKSLAFIARKYKLDYAYFWKWVHGESAATKYNAYQRYLTTVASELGWHAIEGDENEETNF